LFIVADRKQCEARIDNIGRAQ